MGVQSSSSASTYVINPNKSDLSWLRLRSHEKTANFHTESRPSARPIGRGLACFSVGRFAVPLVRVRWARALSVKKMNKQKNPVKTPEFHHQQGTIMKAASSVRRQRTPRQFPGVPLEPPARRAGASPLARFLRLAAYAVLLCAALVPWPCRASSAFAPPVPLTPGSGSAPGPALRESLVGFSWRRAGGATGYRLVVHDADTGQSEGQTLPGTAVFAEFDLIPGHRYAWFLRALVGTNVAAVSSPRYFSVAVEKVVPTISGVLPDPVPAVDGAQMLTVNGTEFLPGCRTVLRDKTTGEVFTNLRIGWRRDSQLMVTPNFTKA